MQQPGDRQLIHAHVLRSFATASIALPFSDLPPPTGDHGINQGPLSRNASARCPTCGQQRCNGSGTGRDGHNLARPLDLLRPTSDSPTCRIFPASRISLSAPSESSIGTFGSRGAIGRDRSAPAAAASDCCPHIALDTRAARLATIGGAGPR